MMKWWGWGSESVSLKLDDYPRIRKFLEQVLAVRLSSEPGPLDRRLPEIEESFLPQPIRSEFLELLGPERCRWDPETRTRHTYGKSYHDLLRLRLGRIENPPDLVVYPETETEIQRIFRICENHRIALIPFGGGTSVVGGVECLKGSHAYSCTMNLTRLKRMLRLDEESLTAEFEVGILGPELEATLNERGFTLGHFPQSFEFSTLGGWIVTRSSGQNSLYYGGIEKLVQSLRVLSPSGEMVTLSVPRMAVGSDWNELILGSEGRLGVVVSAVVRIRPKPKAKSYKMVFFPSFRDGVRAAQELVQTGLRPAMVRVSDEAETRAMMLTSPEPTSVIEKWGKSAFKKYLALKGIGSGTASAMVIGFEGESNENSDRHLAAQEIWARNHGVGAGEKPGMKWLADRFKLPYLRDDLMNHGLLVDTLETAVTWSQFHRAHELIAETIRAELKKSGVESMVYAHLSHLYPDGGSLYFTVLAPQDARDPIVQWQKMKTAANAVIREQGWPISHHHGVGVDHRDFTHWGAVERGAMTRLSRELDPHGILNPGKLVRD